MSRLLYTLLFCGLVGYNVSAQQTSYVAMDIVKVKEGNWPEALYYYENNWKIYREVALKRGVIKSYQLLINKADSVTNNIVLITEYPDSLSFRKSEENFRPILRELRPSGPVFLNAKRRSDFLENIVFNWYQVWVSDNKKR